MKLFLSKELYTDDKETVVLAILNGMYSKKKDYVATSISLIGYEMTGRFLKTSFRKDRTIIDGIKQALQSLAEKAVIEIIDQNNDDYIFSNKGLEVNTEKEYFVLLEQWEMQKIFERANKPFSIFSFFCCLVATINTSTKEWHMTQDEMVSTWGYGKGTVNSYLKQLEDMELIYVYRHKKRRADGTYHKLNNSYGRYADKDAIIKAAQEYANAVECEDIITKIDRRSIKLRYNAFCNNAKKYQNNPAAIMQLYKECGLYNKSLKNNPIEGSYDGEWKHGELLDLSVFSADIITGMDKSEHDDQWGEPDPMKHDFSVEEILDMTDEPELMNSSTPDREDLELMDIDSLFDDDTDDKVGRA